MTHAPSCPYGACAPGQCPIQKAGHPAQEDAACQCDQPLICGLCAKGLKFERVSWVDDWGRTVHGFYAWCPEHYREWRAA